MSLPELANDLTIALRFHNMTCGAQPDDRLDDFDWFRNELRKGSLIAYYQKRDEYEILIDGTGRETTPASM